ncbi:MAG: hypothetical protein RL769_492, partial [Pseudomonadota bacterium]
ISDPSVLSRFNSSFDLSSITSKDLKHHQYQKPSPSLSAFKIEEIIEINFDFEGFEDWQQKLMGRLVVHNDQIIWQKSQFVKDLEKNSTSLEDRDSADLSKTFYITFSNISQENIKKLQEFFAEAIALGYIDFYGYKIRINQEINLKFPSQTQGNFAFSNILKDFAIPRDQEVDRADGEMGRDGVRDGDEDRDRARKTSATQPSLKIYQDQQASSRLPINIHFINSQIFDQLLTIPKVEGEKYHEELGLIEKASKQADRTLRLFISEELSTHQNYCLVSLARKHNVSLELYLAKEARIKDQEFSKFYVRESHPKGIRDLDQSKLASAELRLLSLHSQSLLRASTQLPANSLRIIVSNNLDQASDELVRSLNSNSPSREINLVNVEDVLYQDLFESSDCKIERSSDQTSSSQGSQFVIKILKTVSQIQEKLLDPSQAIIIKGKFPRELLSLLQPQILDIQSQFQNLYFIIEEDVKASSASSSQLSWLDKSNYQIKHYTTQAKSKTPTFLEPYPVVAEISDNPLQSANEFIAKRKNLLAECLKDNALVKIVGHSGVGKSSLFADIKKSGLTPQRSVSVYHELTDIEKFANDEDDEALKILVIDEFNIDGSLNWTMLRDFANCPLSDQSANAQNNRKLFYKGKFYQLSSNHRIVFLGNPKNYGNRYEHQLFKEQNIAELHLQDFSVDYIYQTLLKEPIFSELKDFVKEVIGDGDIELAEKNFKDICLKAIKEYKRLNQKQSDDDSDLPTQTVRELQEEVLKEISKKLTQAQEHLALQSQSSEFEVLTAITKRVTDIASKDFIATQANYDTLEQLAQATRIRQLQKHDLLPDHKLGTNGVIFEGDSGVGKSVMIEALLNHQGITKIDSLDDYRYSQDYPDQKHHYYKLPASLSYQEIEKQLIKAYELGVVVIFDEINTRLNEGLEKIINNLLTGHYHQEQSSFDSQQRFTPAKGFMLIGSINSAKDKGRTSISPAIQHRSNIIKAKPLREYQIADFEKIIVNWLEQSSIQEQQRSREPEDSSGHPVSLPKKDYTLSEITAIAHEFKDCCRQNPKYNLRALKEKLQEILQINIEQKGEGVGRKIIDHSDKFEISQLSRYRDGIFGFQTNKNNSANSNHFFRNDQITDENISAKNQEIKNNIFGIFEQVKKELSISDEDLTFFYLLAVKYQGLGNVISSSNQRIINDFDRLFGEKEANTKIRKAIKFSAIFQKLADEKSFKTGNLSDRYIDVGMRLKRVDPVLFHEYLLKDC